MNEAHKPQLFRLKLENDKNAFDQLIAANPTLQVYDEIDGQLRELIKSLHPSIKIKDDEYPALIEKHLNGQSLREYGVWVYYPWANRVVHLLDEEEFVEVRTNRNRYKITKQEQGLLKQKKIGVVGLSVGQSIALTLVMERVCGEIRLADFDTAELSNLNRIRTGVHNLGVKKTLIAAREIAEIDPFIKVSIFNDGLINDNIDDFFTGGGKLDMLVEVCDGLNIKIISRFKARELKIPVVMDTNDRGMLDVERFDLEPDRPVLHGLAGDLDPEKLKDLSNEDKVPIILKMVGTDTLSMRLKASMMEVEQSINTWPQLASSVVLGGALTTDVVRRIFLNQFRDSGRYYFDFDEIIKDAPTEVNDNSSYDGPPALTLDQLHAIAAKYHTATISQHINNVQLEELIQAACLAPSGGNAQPWKFLYKDDRIFIFHDEHFSYSLLDYNNLGSGIAFGAMIENIDIKASQIGLSAKADILPIKEEPALVAVINIGSKETNTLTYLAPVITQRLTNRNISERILLKPEDSKALIDMAATVPGARLQLFDTYADIEALADVLTNTERIRFMHKQGHYDTFVKELRFSREEVLATADGLDIETLNMTNSEKAALQIARDARAISFLNEMRQGIGFKKISNKNVMAASALGVMTMDGNDFSHFLQGGRALERVWLEAGYRGIAFQPISQIVFMVERYRQRGKLDFNEFEMAELEKIMQKFYKLIDLQENRTPTFVFRLFHGAAPKERALRKPLSKVLFVN